MNERHGEGKCMYIDGSFYDGKWEFNKKQGKGVMTYVNGAVFEGDYIKDERNGPGILKMPNGNRVEAKWSNDMINGEGIYYKGDKAIECVWYDDVRVEINFNDGDKDYVVCYIIT